MFCLWLYLAPAVAHHVFGATNPKSAQYTAGVEWSGLLFSVYNAVAFLAAFVLVAASRRTTPNVIHTLCLLGGAAGLLSIGFIHDPYFLIVPMVGIGIAWASTSSSVACASARDEERIPPPSRAISS